MVGLSGRVWCLDECASECPAHECTPARGPPPHSGAPESLSGTHKYVVGCRSRGSDRGAGSQLGRESTEGDHVLSSADRRIWPLE